MMSFCFDCTYDNIEAVCEGGSLEAMRVSNILTYLQTFCCSIEPAWQDSKHCALLLSKHGYLQHHIVGYTLLPAVQPTSHESHRCGKSGFHLS